jgi:hypothetical protein
MAIGQTTGEAKPGWLGETGNASYRHFFPALKGRVAADARRRRGPRQGHQPCRRAATSRIVSPQRDAGGAGVKNPG